MAVEIRVPQVGESITEVQISEWLKQEGSEVDQDETIATLETDKASVDLSAPVKGVLSEILKKNGEFAKVGDVVAMIDDKGDGSAKQAKKSSSESQKPKEKQEKPSEEKSSEEKPEKSESKPEQKESESQEQPDEKIMPAALRLMEENGLSPEQINGTGPSGRILKEDVQSYLDEQKESENQVGSDEDQTGSPVDISKALKKGNRNEEVVPMTMFRRRVAERLVQAQQTGALLTTFNEIDMSSVMGLRNKFKETFQKKHGVKLGFMSFFVKAVVEALKDLPQLNSEIRGTDIIYRHYFDIGIAIGGGKGLVVPVLRNAENMSFADIESTITDFGTRAKAGKIEIDELKGGTFTITNGGVYGSLMSTPIINPPQSGVLGMHSIQERPVVVDGQIVIRPMMYVALTYDHRIVDGREAVTFLKSIKNSIEDPARIILEV